MQSLRSVLQALQAVMGWENFHLHDFRVGETVIGLMDRPELDMPDNMEVEKAWTVVQVVATGFTEFEYAYDFGDHRVHRLIVEPATRTRVPGSSPLCLGGVWDVNGFDLNRVSRELRERSTDS